MSNQATMNFDQALPYLRSGFILRVHGSDEFKNGQVRQDKGKLQFSRGDSNWESAGDLPLLELQYDVYDQKKEPYVDYTKPLVDRDEGAKAIAQQEASARAGDELGSKALGEQPDHVSEEELRMEALRIFRDQGEDNPSDEALNDLVGQLKAKADELNPVSEQGGGNTPPPSDPDGIQSLTQGYNEQQTDQVLPEEAAGGFGADPIDGVLDESAHDDEGDIPDEETQVAEGDQSVKKHKRGKRH